MEALLIETLTSERAGAAMADRVARALDAPAKSRRRRHRPHRRPTSQFLRVSAAAAVLLLGLAGLAAVSRRSKPPTPAPSPIAAAPDEPIREDAAPPAAVERRPEPTVESGAPVPESPRSPALPAEPAGRPAPPPVPAPKPEAPRTTVVETRPAGRLEAAWGTVQIDGRPATAGQAVPTGAALATGPDESACELRLEDGTTVHLAGETRLRLPGTESSDFALERGVLTARVVPRPPQRPFAVATAEARVQVLGTEFRLSAGPAATRLDVAEGKVKLTSREGKSVLVGAGQWTTTAPGAAPLVRSAPPSPLFSDPSRLWRTESKDPGWTVAWEPAARGFAVSGVSRTDVWRSLRLEAAAPLELRSHAVEVSLDVVPSPGLDPAGDHYAGIELVTRNPETTLDLVVHSRVLASVRVNHGERVLGSSDVAALLAGPRPLTLRLTAGRERVRAQVGSRVLYDGPHGIRDFVQVRAYLRAGCRAQPERTLDRLLAPVLRWVPQD